MSQRNQQCYNRYYERNYSSMITSTGSATTTCTTLNGVGVRVAAVKGRFISDTRNKNPHSAPTPTVSSARPVMITPRPQQQQTIQPFAPRSMSLSQPVDCDFLEICKEGAEDRLRHLMPLLDKLGPASVNKVDKSGKTGVSLVCANGNISMLQLISEIAHVDINLADNEGNSPLHFAAQAGHAEVVQYLLSHFKDLDIDQRNFLGFTPLMKASLQGRNKCVKILLFAGASPVLRDHGRGLCALEWARYCSRPSCADIIDKFMKSSNFTVTSPVTVRNCKENGNDKWNSEPNLQCPGILVGSPETKEGWLKQKIRKAFKHDPSKKSYSLVGELTSTALLASSPLVPTAAMGGGPNSKDSADLRNVNAIVVPKLQIVTADDTTDSTTPDIITNNMVTMTNKEGKHKYKPLSKSPRPPSVPRCKSYVSRR